MNDLELYHHGVVGQKWGVRRYQPYPKGSKVKGGREVGQAAKVKQRSGLSAYVEKRREKKAESARLKLEAEERKRELAKAQKEADKERVLREGSATELLKYKHELTDKELKSSLERIKWYDELSKLSQAEVKDGWKRVDDVMSKLEKANKWSRIVIDSYDNVTKIEKLFSGGQQKKK